jgi:hypothetical protein
MKAISLGWGVQSFTLAAMSALGELEPVDVAIHADTLHESKLTYEFAVRWTPWLEEHGVRVVTVKNPTGGMQEILKKPGQTHIPGYTLAKSDTVVPVAETVITFEENDGVLEPVETLTGNVIYIKPNERGKLNRSCTQRWKITPMRHWLQANRNKEQVEQWIQRMKDSDVKYVVHRWPLIEHKMTRLDCISWLDRNRLEIPPKSSCTFCPFHSTSEWKRIRNIPEDWKEAVAIDKAIRNVRPLYHTFVRSSYTPLEDLDLLDAMSKDQLHFDISLWDEECSGICGV